MLWAWARLTPISAKFIEQLWTEDDIAILPAFSLANMDQHATAIDILDLQLDQFLAPHAGRIEREQPDPMQRTGGALDEPLCFFL